jgi:STE24 endopeptidase
VIVEARIRIAVLAFFALRLLVEGGLLALNLRRARATGTRVPAPLAGRVSPETAARSLAYTLARGRLALVAMAWDAAVTLALLFSGALPWLDTRLASTGWTGGWRFVLFLAGLSVATWIAALPVSLHATFVVEARFGFNRATLATWLGDRAKGIGLSVALGVPILWGAWFLMTASGALWWLWLWAFLAALQIVLLWLYPSVLAPIFNRFSALPPGELRTRLESLCEATGFRSRGLFVMDASRRSSHSNAYFAGIVRPRIVLFDTLVSSMTVDESTAVLAHEIGHFQLRHVAKRLLWGLASSLAGLWILSLLVRWPAFFRAFGFPAPSWGPAVAIVLLAGGAFTFLATPLATFVSRRHEYAADRYAALHTGSPEPLGRALVRLNGENLANLHPHPWYSAWYHGHPTLLERLRALGTGPGAATEAGRQAAARRAASQTAAAAETGRRER